MLNDLGRLALALGALFGAWAALAGLTAIRTGRDAFLDSAHRALVATVGCAALATVALVMAMLADDFSIRFVAANDSVLMPSRYLPAALLGAAGGALPAWAALAGLAALVATRGALREGGAWSIATAGAMLAVALGVATALGPMTSRPIPMGDGLGISPDLQRVAAVVQAIALLVGAAATAGGFLLTVAALASRSAGEAWSRTSRPWHAVAFCALFAGIVAGARIFALNPARGAWLADQSTTVWLIAAAVAAWLAQLDAGRQSPDRAVMRLLLSAGAFIAAAGALAFAGGAFVRGAQSAAPPAVVVWFGAVPLGAVVLLVALLKRGRGAVANAGALAVARRGGGAAWLVRAGVILVAGAGIGAGFSRHHDVEMGDTEIFRTKDPLGRQWSMKSQGVSTLQRENFASLMFTVLPARDSVPLPLLSAEARSYVLATGDDAGPPVLAGGRHAGLFMETRLSLIGPDGRRPTVRIAFVPLGTWLIPGAILLCAGVLLPVAWPRAKERSS